MCVCVCVCVGRYNTVNQVYMIYSKCVCMDICHIAIDDPTNFPLYIIAVLLFNYIYNIYYCVCVGNTEDIMDCVA